MVIQVYPLRVSRARSVLRDGRLPPGCYVATGPSVLPSWFLSALCPALKEGTKLFWIDAGNTFNAYGASYAARALGCDPKQALRQIQLARPFNLFQLETMVRQKVPAKWRGEPIVLSDPFPLFYDEDVPAAEARRILLSVVDGMNALPAIWIVLAVDRKAPKSREDWFAMLTRQAAGSAALEAGDKRWQLARARR